MKKEKPISVLFLVPSPLGISPGQRFRFEHYLPDLDKKGIQYKVSPFLRMKDRATIYSRGNVMGKMLVLTGAYMRRSLDVFRLYRYDFIYIHRWAATAGPPLYEWLIAKVFRKKIIYDFDDAIWVNESAYNKKYLAIKFLGKVAKICKWAHMVTVGNQFLKNFALQHTSRVKIIPTVVNTHAGHSRLQNQDTDRPAVGWTGSFSTLMYLDQVVPVIQRLQQKIDFDFIVIADKDPLLPLKNYSFIKWNKDREMEDLLNFHIGLMPLTDDDITRGKCGFKAIQYMALGIPAIVSPVGVNTEIVDEELNGFICSTDEQWEKRIEELLRSADLRKKMGIAARNKIEKNYSVSATQDSFLQLFSL